MKKIIASILTVLLLLSLLATSALAASLEQDTAQRINLERAARGIAALEISTVLGGKARVKAQEMAENGYFSHTSPTYGSPFTMMRTLGSPTAAPPKTSPWAIPKPIPWWRPGWPRLPTGRACSPAAIACWAWATTTATGRPGLSASERGSQIPQPVKWPKPRG